MTATNGIWIGAQKAFVLLGLAVCALGLFLLLSRFLLVYPIFIERGFWDVGFVILLLCGPAVVVLALAPKMLRRTGEPALWYIFLVLGVGAVTFWMGVQMAAYAA